MQAQSPAGEPTADSWVSARPAPTPRAASPHLRAPETVRGRRRLGQGEPGSSTREHSESGAASAQRAARPPRPVRRAGWGRHYVRLALVAAALVVAAGALVGALAAVIVVVGIAVGAQSVALASARRRARALATVSTRDAVTGLGATAALHAALARQIAETPEGANLSVLLVHVEPVDAIERFFGPKVADAILRWVARVIEPELDQRAAAYRYRERELAVVLPGHMEAAAAAVSLRIQLRVAAAELAESGVSVSCGVAALNGARRAEGLLERAERALAANIRAYEAVPSEKRLARLGDAPPSPTAGVEPTPRDPEAGHAKRRAAIELATTTLSIHTASTADHSEVVVVLCAALAERMGVTGAERQSLLDAARLHDIGKLAIAPEILNKPGPLSAEESEAMRQHTPIGERILRAVPGMDEVATAVRHAHERFDGTGYPDGLAGEQIPLASRIILCADAFHAIREDRPYRPGAPADAAMAELRAHAGTQFDPRVVQALDRARHDLESARHHVLGGEPTAARTISPRLAALLLTLVLGGSAVAAPAKFRHELAAIVGLPSGQHPGVLHRDPRQPAVRRPPDARSGPATPSHTGAQTGAGTGTATGLVGAASAPPSGSPVSVPASSSAAAGRSGTAASTGATPASGGGSPASAGGSPARGSSGSGASSSPASSGSSGVSGGSHGSGVDPSGHPGLTGRPSRPDRPSRPGHAGDPGHSGHGQPGSSGSGEPGHGSHGSDRPASSGDGSGSRGSDSGGSGHHRGHGKAEPGLARAPRRVDPELRHSLG